MLPAELGAASSLFAVFALLAANAVEKLGTASPNANAMIHPMFNLRIDSSSSVTSCKLGRGARAVKQTVPVTNSW